MIMNGGKMNFEFTSPTDTTNKYGKGINIPVSKMDAVAVVPAPIIVSGSQVFKEKTEVSIKAINTDASKIVYTVDGTISGSCLTTSNSVTTNLLIQPNPVITALGNTLTTGVYTSYQWFRYGVAINGATQQTYTAMQDGSYTVRVENAAGCFGVSEIPVVINTLGLSSLSKNGIQVYPNPTERFIEISGNQLMELTIKDLTGKVIITKEQTTKLDLSNVASGIYLLEVRNDNHELVGIEKITKH